jgi:hypothetical protein
MLEKSLFGIGISHGSQLFQAGNRYSGISVSPVPLVTDKSGISQLSCDLITILFSSFPSGPW